jgi:hypothetical protein
MALSGAKLNAYWPTLCNPLPNIRVSSDVPSNSKSAIDTTELGIESVPERSHAMKSQVINCS